jgi:hypothetical protein
VSELILAVLLKSDSDEMDLIILPRPTKPNKQLSAKNPESFSGVKLQSLSSFVDACMQLAPVIGASES